MAYNSAHTGPQIDAAVEMLGQIQSARDATAADRAEVTTLADQVGDNADQVATQAATVSTKTAQVLASATAVEQAHAEVISASTAAVDSKDAAALSAGAAQESQAASGASEFAASQSQLAAGLSEQISAENAASTSEDRTVVDELAQQVEADSESAAISAQNAAAVVTGGTATFSSSPGKIPLADAQGKIDPEWLSEEIARTSAIQGAIDTAQSAEDSADLATARTARFLAPASTPPTLRDDGAPLQLGDRYVSAGNQAEYIYKSSGWGLNDSLVAIAEIQDATDPTKGSAKVGHIAAGAGASPTTVQDKLRQIVNVEDYAVDGEPDDTDMIQRAINAVYSTGGGVVLLQPKTYEVSTTKETLPVILISAGGGLNPTTTLTQSCIVLRAGVTLVGAGKGVTVLQAPEIQRSVLTLYRMDGGGAAGITYDGGKGVTSAVSDLDDICANYTLVEPEVRNSLSYGIGIQMGFSYNVKIVRPHVHNCAQDGIDFKARARPSTGELPYGNAIIEPLIELYGQTSATESAGIDFRGQMHVVGGTIRDFSVPGKNNIGVRASTGVNELNDKRVASYKSIVHGLYINSGNAADTGVVGLAVYESSHDCFSDVIIEDCHTGVNVAATTTGNGRSDFLKITGVEVFGARGNSFQTTEDRNSFLNCHAIAAEDYFSEGLDNLVPGQATLVVGRTFLSATVKVYKNEVLLPLGSGYTITGTTDINLAVPAIAGDIFMVQTPGSRGFNFQTGAEGRSGTNGIVVGCTTKGMTTPIDANALCKASLMEGLNQFEGCGFSMAYSLASAELQATGPGANIEGEIRSKGTAGITVRANGARAARFVNPASAVNWAEVQGSIAGSPVQYRAAGSDAKIDIMAVPKGVGNFGVPIGNVPAYANDAAAASGGVIVGGFYRIGSALQVRAS